MASRATSRVGLKPTLLAGLVLFAAGLAWLAQVTDTSTFTVDILGPSLLIGAGLGLSFVALTIGSVTGTAPNKAGLASGLINSSQQVGGALGLAIAATIATAQTTRSLAAGQAPAAALTAGFQLAFLAGAALAALAAVIALTLMRNGDPPPTPGGDIPQVHDTSMKAAG